MLRGLDFVAVTRVVPMGFGNARHGGKSTEEHEREDDDLLHLDLPPSISHHLRVRHRTGWSSRHQTSARTHKFGSSSTSQLDVTEIRTWASHERVAVKRGDLMAFLCAVVAVVLLTAVGCSSVSVCLEQEKGVSASEDARSQGCAPNRPTR